MYDNHQPKIAEYALKHKWALCRTLTFVVCSIRVPLYRVHLDMADIEENGIGSSVLWGTRAKAIAYIKEHKDRLFDEVNKNEELYARGFRVDESAMATFLQVPGIGLAKAGFACTLIHGTVGCIDRHNVKLYPNIPSKVLKWRNRKSDITDYLFIIERCGTPRTLWNNWCNYVAMGKFGRVYNYDAWRVSHAHTLFIPQERTE